MVGQTPAGRQAPGTGPEPLVDLAAERDRPVPRARSRRSGGRSITTRSSSSSGCRPSSSSGGRPRWRSTRGSTTPFRRLAEYLKNTDSWGAVHASILRSRPVAYFSAEFGLHESLPIYSGGLGVLAGDHLKSASDLGIPLIGVGLLYAQGYFRQTLDADGWQQELYLNADLELLPIESVPGPDGKPLMIAIETATGVLRARVWRVEVGRTTLLLLDSNVPENTESDRALTARLYGGDARVRIRQELLLGVGGVRALHALGIHPSVLHLNEGHSAFADARDDPRGDGGRRRCRSARSCATSRR